jgi:GT2 family glycosyltransferase
MEFQRLNTISIAAVVVTYNRKVLLKKCLDGLLNQTRPLDEIIILDNASSDGTEEFIALRYPKLTYRRLTINYGGSGGFKEGIKLAYEKGHHWIMDDDVKPVSNTLHILVSQLEIYRDALCLVPRRVNENGETIMEEGRIITDKKLLETFEYPNLLSEGAIEVNKITFEGPLLCREGIQKIGLPDVNYFLLFDDVDYGFRLSQVGRIYYIRDAIFEKMLPTIYDFADANQWKWYYRWRNYIYFMRKNLRRDATRKIWYWLKEDVDIKRIRDGFRCLDWNRIKYGLILFIAIRDSFGKMGKKYSPGELVIKGNALFR